MIDIAVPRDIDPELDKFDNVFLYNIDDLEQIVENNLLERKKIAQKIESMILETREEFQAWLNTLGVVPIISALRTKALAIQADVMASIERKLPDLTERERKVIQKHTKSIINQMLRDPILSIKEMATEPNASEIMDTFIKIFAIEEEVKREKEKQQTASKTVHVQEKNVGHRTNRSFAEISLRP